MSLRYLTNRSRTDFRERLTDEVRDFDGRLLQAAVWRVVTKEQIVSLHGESAIAKIPVIANVPWEFGPELLGLKP
jgi:hypothetical protein